MLQFPYFNPLYARPPPHRRSVLIDTNITWPNCLTVDWATDELYWGDAKHNSIEAVRLDGANRRRLLAYSGQA